MSESMFGGGILQQCLMLGAVGWLSALALASLDFHLGGLYPIVLN